MANPSKRKGTEGENLVRDFFRANGYPYADRLTQTGTRDRGDIRLGDGIPVTVEVKAGSTACSDPHSHLRELVAEMENNGHDLGFVLAKKRGTNNVDNWVVMTTPSVLLQVLEEVLAARRSSS